MDLKFMLRAIELAKQATQTDDVPVGCVIVKDGEIVAESSNMKEVNNDATKHAEMVAISKATQVLGNWWLEDCDVYVTLEPCPMCAWAILQSRIKSVYFGSYDTQYGAFGSKLNLPLYSSNKINIKGGIMEEECNNILNKFFKKVRDDN